jgi:hypothetical protein
MGVYHAYRHVREAARGLRPKADQVGVLEARLEVIPAQVGTAFLIVAIILFILGALPIPEPYGGRLVPIGLAFFAAAHLV